jgi:hypothetical protein
MKELEVKNKSKKGKKDQIEFTELKVFDQYKIS